MAEFCLRSWNPIEEGWDPAGFHQFYAIVKTLPLMEDEDDLRTFPSLFLFLNVQPFEVLLD
ncbi:hypothetical protein HPP92_027359 [Vanilla planifolia]|uniref:Uncharacterized protein n=1 Tax=Vanilla planifolia TaxID=51239 RepID=A0A835U5L1_VANPL|nr:hypothetical protein HPP92_027359 [Vanilla planifolia]KAG0449338.1 hypothetical protein HPP92_027378 [Vanilla planifolia]